MSTLQYWSEKYNKFVRNIFCARQASCRKKRAWTTQSTTVTQRTISVKHLLKLRCFFILLFVEVNSSVVSFVGCLAAKELL